MHSPSSTEYLDIVNQNFADLKDLGDRAFSQLEEQAFHFKLDAGSNSIATLIQHIHGNMVSRFTDFLTTDGEKPTRNRDGEFEKAGLSQEQLLGLWETGWLVLFDTLRGLTEKDLSKTVLIRSEPHSVLAAINRQVAHYAAHVGQIVFLAKHIQGTSWKSLSIPRGKSAEFNQDMLTKKH